VPERSHIHPRDGRCRTAGFRPARWLSVTSNYRNMGSLRGTRSISIFIRNRHPFPGPEIGCLFGAHIGFAGALI